MDSNIFIDPSSWRQEVPYKLTNVQGLGKEQTHQDSNFVYHSDRPPSRASSASFGSIASGVSHPPRPGNRGKKVVNMSYTELATQMILEPTARDPSSYVESWRLSTTDHDPTYQKMMEDWPNPVQYNHNKLFTCDIPSCQRNRNGFSTASNLARHKKSAHGTEALQDYYQCASENCRARGKIWPRLDNFKQHIIRMHRDEDEHDLIRRSVYHPPEQTPTAEIPSVAPVETTLAGIGTERQFAGNGLDGSVSNPAAKSYEAPLNLLADAASIQTSPEHQNRSRRPQLSNASQAKAQQQRQKLEKLSKAIVGEMQNSPSGDLDLENAVLRVLSAQTTTNIIEQGAKRAPFNSRSRRDASELSTNMLKCSLCNAILPRSRDMKKHMKRHTKPYGCTYPQCHKRFGAKTDWKRHENNQHFQMESFRCQQTCSSSQTPCGKFFTYVELFKTHLKTKHKMTQDEPIQHEVKACRIGRNGQGQFWCGFCRKIVKLKEKRAAAWDERFDHIGSHYNKDRMRIDQWLCVEARKMKGEVLREMGRTELDKEGHDGAGDSDDSNAAAGEIVDGMQSQPRPASAPMLPWSSSRQSSSSASRKRIKLSEGD